MNIPSTNMKKNLITQINSKISNSNIEDSNKINHNLILNTKANSNSNFVTNNLSNSPSNKKLSNEPLNRTIITNSVNINNPSLKIKNQTFLNTINVVSTAPKSNIPKFNFQLKDSLLKK